MSTAPSAAVQLYGTEEPSPAPRILRAGPLAAEFDAGNLRHIRFGDVEIIRAVSFIVRDKDWGTYNPVITDLTVEETPKGFSVSYDAVARDAQQEFRFRATIEGSRSGLSFRGEGEAVTDFLTNRTGFVTLHPIEGVAGHPVEIEHVDGRIVNGRFPELIDPVQPMMDLRALKHEAVPGLSVICRMEGDTFEMEDQRNWSDASYKTYVRPLALPWPYTLPTGTRIDQTISLVISGSGVGASPAGGVVTLGVGDLLGPAPQIGFGLDPGEFAATRSMASSLAEAKPQHIVCHYDPRLGHDVTTLREAAGIAISLGAKPWLEAVIATVDDFVREVTDLGMTISSIGSPFEAVFLSPAPDLKCTLPGSPWPPAPPADELFRVARKAFPGVRIGGGMFSFFTELNRKRPPLADLDLVNFTTVAMIHAGDDRSVMEGLEALPAIARSAQAIAGDLPLAVGPSAIGLRMNPYGAAPMRNPDNIRQAMNYNDPRQRGLLGAAWVLGYYSHFARAGVEAVAFGGTTGPFGLVHTPQDWPAPWYGEHGGLYPAFHVLRGLAGVAGQPLLALDISSPSIVQGFAVKRDGGYEIWLANLTAERQQISLPTPARNVSILDAEHFVEAAQASRFFDRFMPAPDRPELTLEAFALARVCFAE